MLKEIKGCPDEWKDIPQPWIGRLTLPRWQYSPNGCTDSLQPVKTPAAFFW